MLLTIQGEDNLYASDLVPTCGLGKVGSTPGIDNRKPWQPHQNPLGEGRWHH